MKGIVEIRIILAAIVLVLLVFLFVTAGFFGKTGDGDLLTRSMGKLSYEELDNSLKELDAETSLFLGRGAGESKSTTTAINNLDEDFESYDLGEFQSLYWQVFVDNGGEAQFSIVEGGRDGKGKALQVDVRQAGTLDPWDIQLVNDNISVSPHTINHVTAWVKGPRGTELTLAVERTDYSPIMNVTTILNGQWQQLAFEAMSDVETIRAPLHFSFPENVGVRLLIDEIRISPAPAE